LVTEYRLALMAEAVEMRAVTAIILNPICPKRGLAASARA